VLFCVILIPCNSYNKILAFAACTRHEAKRMPTRHSPTQNN
jgi:hypothetical protein